MKNSVISSLELDVKIRKVILQTSKEFRRNNHPQKASLDSDLAISELPTGVKFLSSKFKILLAYLVLYHYYPWDSSVFCYLHLDLLDHIEKSESYWLQPLLEDRDYLLMYLEKQEYMTEQQFFSGIVNVKKLVEVLESIKLNFEEKFRRPRKLVYRKGYRDKGSLGDPSLRVIRQECRNDFYLTLYHYELEEKKLIRSEETQLFKSYLSEGRVLTDELLIKFKLQKGVIVNERERSFTAEDYCKRRETGELEKQDSQLPEGD